MHIIRKTYLETIRKLLKHFQDLVSLQNFPRVEKLEKNPGFSRICRNPVSITITNVTIASCIQVTVKAASLRKGTKVDNTGLVLKQQSKFK